MTITEYDDYGRENLVNRRIRTADGEMMSNRLVQLFSQYSYDRLTYNPELEMEILNNYMEKFCVGFSILTILQDNEIARGFADAVYGPDDTREIPDVYTIFVQWSAKNMHRCLVEWLREGRQTSISDITVRTAAQFFKDERINIGDINVLLRELLKARNRIKKFNLHHIDEAEYFMESFDDCDG